MTITPALYLTPPEVSSKKIKKFANYEKYKSDPEDRKRVGQAFLDIAERESQSGLYRQSQRLFKEADRFCKCGTSSIVKECYHDNLKFYQVISCNSRICESCSRRYYASIKVGLNRLFEPLYAKKRRGWGVFMVTISVTKERFGDDLPERSDIKRFYDESSKFFRYFYGKHKCRLTKAGKVVEVNTRSYKRADGKKVKIKPRMVVSRSGAMRPDYRKFRGCGYLATVEVGQNNNNLHCHALVYAPYISQIKLANFWRKITGDSYIVDIRPIKDVKHAVNYVAKYIVKPPGNDSFVEVANYAVMIKGTRRIRTGGIFYNRLKKLELVKLDYCCPFCGGYLHDGGEATIDKSKENYYDLYGLLKEKHKRGSPLDYPDGFKVENIIDRGNRRAADVCKQLDDWSTYDYLAMDLQFLPADEKMPERKVA